MRRSALHFSLGRKNSLAMASAGVSLENPDKTYVFSSGLDTQQKWDEWDAA